MNKKKLQNKLTTYSSLSKGFQSEKLQKNKLSVNSELLLKSVLLALPVVGLSQLGNAQCLGPVNSGNVINIAGNGGVFSVDLNGDNVNDMRFRNPQIGGGSLYVSNIPAGDNVVFFTNNSSVQTFTGAIGGANTKGTGVWIAFSDGTKGAIQNGNTKFFGFKIGTNEGFMQLTVNHDGASTYKINILERGTSVSGSATAGNCGTLPVELNAFTAEIKKQAVMLTWQTATELYNSGFEVQRSSDGENFTAIDFIEGKGTSLGVEDYSYTDGNIRIGQEYYYRLKQIDYDGQFEYSEVVSVEMEGSNATISNFYPNPTKGGTQLEYTANVGGELAVTVYNVSGQELTREVRNVAEGTNNLNFDFSTLSKGAYFVKLQAGEDSQYQKLIID